MVKKVCKELIAECVRRGYARKGETLSRCIGDAVYQNINLAATEFRGGETTRIPVIKIGFWSMYSSLPAFYFDERQRVGLFFPENLVGRRFVGGDHSLENECGIMLSSGLDLLYSLTTQKQVVEYSRAFRLLQEGQEQEYCSDLCAPLVLCGDYDRAREILQSIYVRSCLAFHRRNDRLRDMGRCREYVDAELLFEQEELCGMSRKELKDFMVNVISKNDDGLNEYFDLCLKRNIRCAKVNKIAFSKDFSPNGMP